MMGAKGSENKGAKQYSAREGGSKATKGRRIERWEEKGRDEGSGRDAVYHIQQKAKAWRSEGVEEPMGKVGAPKEREKKGEATEQQRRRGTTPPWRKIEREREK
jgi:hypothetical protein